MKILSLIASLVLAASVSAESLRVEPIVGVECYQPVSAPEGEDLLVHTVEFDFGSSGSQTVMIPQYDGDRRICFVRFTVASYQNGFGTYTGRLLDALLVHTTVYPGDSVALDNVFGLDDFGWPFFSWVAGYWATWGEFDNIEPWMGDGEVPVTFAASEPLIVGGSGKLGTQTTHATLVVEYVLD